MKGPLRIPARGDGYLLGAELFLPQGPPKAAVLIAGAMAVRAAFYAPFSRYLSEQRAAALIFDYRGIGGSRPAGPLRRFDATFHDWGERDLAGCLDWLAGRFPGLPLLFVGHSAGAQLMGLAPEPPIRPRSSPPRAPRTGRATRAGRARSSGRSGTRPFPRRSRSSGTCR